MLSIHPDITINVNKVRNEIAFSPRKYKFILYYDVSFMNSVMSFKRYDLLNIYTYIGTGIY